MVGERCLNPFKRLLFVLLFGLIFCSFLAAEQKASESGFPSKDQIEVSDYAPENFFMPLEAKSFLNSEVSQLIEEKAYPKIKLDFNLIKFDPVPYSSKNLQKIIRLNRIENSLYTTSLITLTALNVADYFSTLKALQYEGLREANPIMKPFTKNTFLFTAMKLGLTVYNFHYLKNLHLKNKRLAWAVSLIANFVMTYIVANNIMMIQEAQKR